MHSSGEHNDVSPGVSTTRRLLLVSCVRTFMSSYPAEEKIGLLGAIRPAVTLFAGPFICAFAEKYGIAQKVRLLVEDLLVYRKATNCRLMPTQIIFVEQEVVKKNQKFLVIDGAVTRKHWGRYRVPFRHQASNFLGKYYRGKWLKLQDFPRTMQARDYQLSFRSSVNYSIVIRRPLLHPPVALFRYICFTHYDFDPGPLRVNSTVRPQPVICAFR